MKRTLMISFIMMIGYLQLGGFGLENAQADYLTPNTGVVWTMDDLVSNASLSVTGSGSQFEFINNVTIMPKDTLKIEAGQILRFRNHTSLTIWGNIQAEGTNSSRINFTSVNTNPKNGDWSGLIFDGSITLDGQKSSLINFCIIEYAEVGIRCKNSSVTIKNSIIRSINSSGLELTLSNSLVLDNEFIDVDINGESCTILLNNSWAVIDHNSISNCSEIGIKSNADHSTLINNTISNVTVGVHINNSIGIEVKNNNFTALEIGILATNKSSCILKENDFNNIKVGVMAVEESKLQIEHNIFRNYNGTGISINSNDNFISNNIFQYIANCIMASSYANINIISNTMANVTNAISLNSFSKSLIAHNVINSSKNICIELVNSNDINISSNRLNHPLNGITLKSSGNINIYNNIILYSQTTGITIDNNVQAEIEKNKVLYGNKTGLLLKESKPKKFQSNMIRDNNKYDLEIYGSLYVDSIDNIFSYLKLKLASGVKLNVTNFFTVSIQDRNGIPLENVLIELYTNDIKTHEFYTDVNGKVSNILLLYREYQGQNIIKEDPIILIATYEDMNFDYNFFQLNMSKSWALALHTNYLPELTVLWPEDNSTLSGTVQINGSAFDPDTPIKSIWIQLGSSDWESVTALNDGWTQWYYQLDTTKYPDGIYQINFSISDGYANVLSSITAVIYNGGTSSKELTIKIELPFESEAVWNTIVIKGRTNAGKYDIKTVMVSIDDLPWVNATPKSKYQIPGRNSQESRSWIMDWSNWTYTLDTRTLTNGDHRVRALVSDGKEITIDSIHIFVTNLPEDILVDLHVDFESPKNGETVNGTVFVTGIVWGSFDPILDFKLDIDGRSVPNTQNVQGPNWWMWSYDWDTTLESNGPHEIQVWANNRSRTVTESITVIVDNEPQDITEITELTILIFEPTEGEILNGTVNINGYSWAEEGEIIENVWLRIDEGDWNEVVKVETNWIRWSYKWDTLPYPNGIHTITAKLTTHNRSVSTSVVIVLNNFGLTSDLSIVITEPHKGDVINGTVTIRGVAWYGDYPIISVEVQFGQYLWVRAEPLRDDWSIWYYELNTTTLKDGNYTLQCRVFDGHKTVKNSIFVHVRNNESSIIDNGDKPDDTDGSEDEEPAVKTSDEFNEELIIIIIIIILVIILILLFLTLRSIKKDLSQKDSKGDEDIKEDEDKEDEQLEEE
ncbi:MAG: right-handed parallel beta-helix repeat-containing protein [Thermoplasmata archaeon]|nr:MAG: right-handed parallel beta-helix repeat-containing protein [Thermoplasmata archaeon]